MFDYKLVRNQILNNEMLDCSLTDVFQNILFVISHCGFQMVSNSKQYLDDEYEYIFKFKYEESQGDNKYYYQYINLTALSNTEDEIIQFEIEMIDSEDRYEPIKFQKVMYATADYRWFIKKLMAHNKV